MSMTLERIDSRGGETVGSAKHDMKMKNSLFFTNKP